MDRRGRWVRRGVVFVAAPLLLAACVPGVTWRYAAVTAANLVPVPLLAAQLRRRAGVDRAAWVVMLVGTVVLVAHNAGNQVALGRTGSPAVGALAAVTLALGYALLLVGGVLVALPVTRRDPGGMLEAAMIGMAVASLMWAVVLHPAHARLGSSAATIGDEMALVLLVTALTGVALRTAVVSPDVRPAALSLLVAILAADVADVVFTVTEDPATGLSSWWASALCVVALLAFAAALAHPSLRAVEGTGPDPGTITTARLAFLGAALAVNPALAVVQRALGQDVDVTLLGAASLLMVPLVVWRVGLLAHRQAETERRLLDLASRDDLTGLPNRRATTAHLERVLDEVASGSSPGVVVLYLDLDDFKAVNDTHGHWTGDRLLCAVAGRLRGCVRATDLVARFGGDEFVLVLEGEPAPTARAVVASIERALSEPVAVGDVLASSRVSIGVAAAVPGQRVGAQALLHQADVRMYRAKRDRRAPSARRRG